MPWGSAPHPGQRPSTRIAVTHHTHLFWSAIFIVMFFVISDVVGV